MMEQFYPDGCSLFQGDLAYVDRARGLAESFNEDENDVIISYGFYNQRNWTPVGDFELMYYVVLCTTTIKTPTEGISFGETKCLQKDRIVSIVPRITR